MSFFALQAAAQGRFQTLQLTIPDARGSIKAREDPMRSRPFIRSVLLCALLAGLAIPPGTITALAQGQAGPQPAPPPTQEPGPQSPPQSGQQGPQEQQGQKPPEYSISVESNLVNVDVVVTDQDGNILTGLTKQNFRVLDDGQPQQITNFSPTDAPITIVMLMEFSNLFGGWFGYTGRYWSFDFLNHLNQRDWVAFVTYSMRSRVEVDFTQNKMEVQQAIQSLYFPDFREANMFDAVLDTIDRLQDVKGKKSILLVASGFDTFSKHTLDQTYKRLKQTDVTIFCVGVAENIMQYMDSRGGLSGTGNVAYLQAKNEMDTFAKMTGGYAWFPRFDGELPGIFQSVAAFLRNQYTVGFTPSNAAHDGKYHKLKVEAVEPDGSPLNITNKKGKREKIQVYAREGYTAPKGAVSMLDNPTMKSSASMNRSAQTADR
jgi:VWFA-related protein